jgi:hypothetical protein
MNRSSGRTCDIGQNRLMNFVIYFLLTCGLPIWQGSFSYKDVIACFRNLLVLQRSLMGYKNSFQVWQRFINVWESFSYKDSLFILATTKKEDFRINSTFRLDLLVYLGLLNSDKNDSSISRIVIFGFLSFLLFSSYYYLFGSHISPPKGCPLGFFIWKFFLLPLAFPCFT